MPRPKLEKIRLIYKVAGSETPLEMDLDPARTTSLFFDEHAAVEILGGFYESKNRTITKDQAIARFGIRAEAWFPAGKTEVPLNKAFMKLAWGNDKKDGKKTGHGECLVFQRADVNALPMSIGKDPDCWPNGNP